MIKKLEQNPRVGGDLNGTLAPPDNKTPFTDLKARIKRDKFIRISLEFMRRYGDALLKMIEVDEPTDQRRVKIAGREVWNFGSDSFLGLDRDPRIQRAIVEAMPRWGTHNGASRAFSSVTLAEEVEHRLARWLGVEDTLLFPSVTLANVGLLPALAVPKSLLIVDRHSHDSVHQGTKLAESRGALLRELTPCSPEALDRALNSEPNDACLVALDGVYSMTGASPPLAEIDAVTRRHGATLYIDDAHGTGVSGPRGRGAAFAALGSLSSVLAVGSLSKAFSCLGAFVTCDPELKLLLKLRSSTFIFGGPVPPPYLNAVLAATEIIDSVEGDALRQRLRDLIARLTSGVRSLGLTLSGGGESAIVSVVVGEIETALEAGKWLFDRGIYVQSAHYPAVPIQGSLLRVQVNANHPVEAIDDLLNALADLKVAFKLPSR
jgi:7-keto-8-aminopelargonate synthetase-like enzyme